VRGIPAQAKGSIELSDITEVKSHSNFLCPAEKQPKSMDKTFCMHIVTISRTYNLLGFQSKEEIDLWLSEIKFALRGHNDKKAIKKWLRDNPRTLAKKLERDQYRSKMETEEKRVSSKGSFFKAKR